MILLICHLLIFLLQYPCRDSVCSSYSSRETCLSQTTAFDDNKAACSWIDADDDSVGTDSCVYNDQMASYQVRIISLLHKCVLTTCLKAVIVIIMLAAILIMPFNLFLDFLFNNVLNAPRVADIEEDFNERREKERLSFEKYKISAENDCGFEVQQLKQPAESITVEDLRERFLNEGAKFSYRNKYRLINDDLTASRTLALLTCKEEFVVNQNELLVNALEDTPNTLSKSSRAKVHNVDEDLKPTAKKIDFASFIEDFVAQHKELEEDDLVQYERRWGYVPFSTSFHT